MSLQPEQLKTKWLKDGSVDGTKIKIKKNQSIKGTKQDGSEVELLKLNSSDNIEVLGSEVAVKADVQAEALARQSADGVLAGQISSEVTAREQAVSALELEITGLKNEDISLQSSISAVSSGLAQEVLDRQAGDAAAVLEAKGYADQKIAELVDSAPAVLDTLKELSEALGNDANFAATVSNNIGTVAANLASEITRAQSAEDGLSSSIAAVNDYASTIDANLIQEVSDRILGDGILNNKVTVLEDVNKFLEDSVYNDAAIVFADGDKGLEDPSSATRDGWYYENKSAGAKINWYFYDGTKQTVTLENFSAYAIMTFDQVTSPIFGIYTVPTGSNDVIPGFAHSRIAYSVMSPTPVVGKKYLVYFGQNPAIHPELPRIQLGKSVGSSLGEQLPNEVVLTSSFGTNSGASVNSVKIMVESLGVNSPSYKSKVSLKIKHATKESVTALSSTVSGFSDQITSNTNSISALQSSVTSLQSGLNSEISRAQAAEAQVLVDAKAYTDSAVSSKASVSYVDTQDAAKLVEAKSYADSVVASEASAREAADSVLAAAIEANKIEFGKSDKTLLGADAFVDLDHKVIHNSLIVFCDCYPLHLGTHYTASDMNGKTRLTFIGYAAPGEIQEFEAGEVIHATYAKA